MILIWKRLTVGGGIGHRIICIIYSLLCQSKPITLRNINVQQKVQASLIFHTKAVDDSACQTLNMKKGFIKWVHMILLNPCVRCILHRIQLEKSWPPIYLSYSSSICLSKLNCFSSFFSKQKSDESPEIWRNKLNSLLETLIHQSDSNLWDFEKSLHVKPT